MVVRLVTPRQIAADWGVSVRTVRRLVRTERLQAVKVGRVWRIPEQAADNYALGDQADPERTPE